MIFYNCIGCKADLNIVLGAWMIIIKLLALLGSLPWVMGSVATLLMKNYVPRFQDVRFKTLPNLPKLSILVPACNESETIEASLRSLLRQTYQNFENDDYLTYLGVFPNFSVK